MVTSYTVHGSFHLDKTNYTKTLLYMRLDAVGGESSIAGFHSHIIF
jgi:hypothetical protein